MLGRRTELFHHSAPPRWLFRAALPEGGPENILEMVKLVQPFPDVGESVLDERLYFLAGGCVPVSELEERFDVAEREARGLSGSDESKTLENLFNVVPIVPGGSAGGTHEAASFVVTHGRHRHLGSPRQLTDRQRRAHDRPMNIPGVADRRQRCYWTSTLEATSSPPSILPETSARLAPEHSP